MAERGVTETGSADSLAPKNGPERIFVVTTQEHVTGTYFVHAESEAEARAKFDRKPGQLIDWEGVAARLHGLFGRGHGGQ